MLYTLDSNVVVDALRQPRELERLGAFLHWAIPWTVLSSVVAAELSAGARTKNAVRVLEVDVLAPFERRNRIVAPSAAAWKRTGALMAEMGPTWQGAARQNDILLATQARERGWTLITRDRDFEALQTRVAGLRVTAPFPMRP